VNLFFSVPLLVSLLFLYMFLGVLAVQFMFLLSSASSASFAVRGWVLKINATESR
jgi:hypothetical protein